MAPGSARGVRALSRLPRLIGEENASEVILKGKLYSASEALKLGLVDEVVPREQLLDAARKKLGEGKRSSGAISSSQPITPPPSDPKSARARALAIINTGRANPMDESLRLELEAIVDLGRTESTQNLIRNFFLAEKYKEGTSKAEFPKVAHAAVIGAGVMGSGIAQWLSSRGVTVILRDVNRELLDRGLANIEKIYGDGVKRVGSHNRWLITWSNTWCIPLVWEVEPADAYPSRTPILEDQPAGRARSVHASRSTPR